MSLLEGSNYLKVEVLSGPVDGVNQEFFTSEPYIEIFLIYNGVFYQPGNLYFKYDTFPGTNRIVLDGWAPEPPGDCPQAIFITEQAPAPIIGIFPDLVVTLAPSPDMVISSPTPNLGVGAPKPELIVDANTPNTRVTDQVPGLFVDTEG